MKKMLRLFWVPILVLCSLSGEAQVNFSNGLVAFYPFNGSFNDASGNGNNGTAMNGATFGTDQWGNVNSAASFDGIDDWVDVGVPSFTFGHKFSFAFRFQTSSGNTHQVLLSKSDWTPWPEHFNFQVAFDHPVYSSKGIYLATDHSGNCTYGSSWVPSHFGISDTPILANKWYCVVITFDSGLKSIYLNGNLAFRGSVTGANATTTDSCTTGRFRMGAWYQGDPRYFGGLMDELRVYNRVLNQQEIDSFCNLKGTPRTIINRYAAIQQIAPDCNNSFVVDNAFGFHVGDTVLMIQMKGATIDTSNTASFGNILNYNGAGNYEFNTIKRINGNTISLYYQVKRNYDIPNGKVQFVRVPYFANYTVGMPHTCMAWNGSKGGVFAVNVGGTLTLNDNIDVSGKGFRGGIANRYYRGNWIPRCNETGFFHQPNFDTSAQKGEGISSISFSKSFGRGKLANGGGGANAVNTGGGGGSNGGTGGMGGLQYGECTPSSASNIYAGVGGAAVSSTSKAYLGGGGGAGHTNDETPSDGGDGGGIILINANAIAGQGNALIANGANAFDCGSPRLQCQNDGAGGGGGGGTILVQAASITATGLHAQGGNGANVYESAAPLMNDFYHGPGGGGGGGFVEVASALSGALGSADVSGGANGTIPQASNIAYGAQPGNPGTTSNSLVLAAPTTIFKSGVVPIDFTYKLVSCNTAQFSVVPSGSFFASYSWHFQGGDSSHLANPSYTFPGPGNYTVTLYFTDSNGCVQTVTKLVTILPFTGSSHDTSICQGQSVALSTYAQAQTYLWSPPLGLSNPTIYNPIASPTTTTTYIVAVNAGPGCTFEDTFTIHVSAPIKADFNFYPRPPIPNTPIYFNNLSSGADTYLWDFGDGTTGTDKDIEHLFRKTATFRVCLIASNGACSDSTCKMVDAEVRTAIAVPSAFSPNGDGANDVLYARGAGVVSFRLTIFNRWGQQVFETTDLKKGWDGTYKGKPQEAESYAYILVASFIDGSHYQKTGNLSLIQ